MAASKKGFPPKKKATKKAPPDGEKKKPFPATMKGKSKKK